MRGNYNGFDEITEAIRTEYGDITPTINAVISKARDDFEKSTGEIESEFDKKIKQIEEDASSELESSFIKVECAIREIHAKYCETLDDLSNVSEELFRLEQFNKTVLIQALRLKTEDVPLFIDTLIDLLHEQIGACKEDDTVIDHYKHMIRIMNNTRTELFMDKSK